ncbi:uncharacterized protein LOC117806328 [Xyrichtys novacula]|uniref:Uncharacterized protein LOC117806328 n=1 Tax=Xyrichtys novacula TaxID=13765 RepID=A0AAV1FGS8_XYRNO|nr:uncharacterized protein LOC117806328 [Xyrichtys novacula]
MWLWIITGLNIIVRVRGFSSGGFPQSCGTMLPQHGVGPTVTDAPFEISYVQGNEGDPFTVTLRSTDGGRFLGFMLEAREEGGPAVGRFSGVDGNPVFLLNCDGLTASAISQRNSQPKTTHQVKWMPPERLPDRDISFRATFLRSFVTYWVNVTKTLDSTTTTTPSTTAQKTTPVTTEHMSTSSTGVPTPTPTPPPPHCPFEIVILMVVCSVLLVTKMEMSNIIANSVTKSPVSRLLNRMSKISFLVFCGALEISALVLGIVKDCSSTALIALLCVAITLTVLEIVISSLPLGPSHELKGICEIFAKVCSVIHEAFILAVIYVCYLESAGTRGNRKNIWPLWVLIAYTVWILLFVVWVFIFTVHKHAILRRRKRGE